MLRVLLPQIAVCTAFATATAAAAVGATVAIVAVSPAVVPVFLRLRLDSAVRLPQLGDSRLDGLRPG